FSEPETQNVKWLLDTNPRTRWFIDIRSYSEDILYNWGDDDNLPGLCAEYLRGAVIAALQGLPPGFGYGGIPKNDSDHRKHENQRERRSQHDLTFANGTKDFLTTVEGDDRSQNGRYFPAPLRATHVRKIKFV